MNTDSRVWYLRRWSGVDTQTIAQCIKDGEELFVSESAAWEAEVDRQQEALAGKEREADSLRERLAEARARLMAARQKEDQQ